VLSEAGSPKSKTQGSIAFGYLLVALAAASWGTWPLILRTAEHLAPMPAAVESTILMLVIAVVTGPLVLRDRVREKATPGEWLGVAWLGVADALNALFFFMAYQRTSVAVAVLSHYLAPLFVAVAAPLLLRERPSLNTYCAVGIAFIGLVLLLRPWEAAAHPTDAAGAAFGAASAFFYASNVLANKRLSRAFSGSELMFFHCFVALPLLVALVPRGAWGALDARAAGIVALGSLGPGALAGLFFVWGLRRIEASHASTLTLLEPLVAMLLGVAVYGERIGVGGLFGSALILGGAGMVMAMSRRAEEPGAADARASKDD
jgi:drug/metabolite transporter (DMT)-like permease